MAQWLCRRLLVFWLPALLRGPLWAWLFWRVRLWRGRLRRARWFHSIRFFVTGAGIPDSPGWACGCFIAGRGYSTGPSRALISGRLL